MRASATTHRTPLFFVCAFALVLACDQVKDLGDQGDGGSSGKDQSGDGDGTGPDKPVNMGEPVTLTSQQVCEQLITCAGKQSPSQFPEFFPIYGTNGTCWQDHTEAECRQGCIDAIKALYDPSNEGCKYCDDDMGCPRFGSTGNFAACHPQYHYCATCESDDNCQSETWTPYCDLTYTYQCVQCLKDSDCDTPDCSVDQNTCSGTYCQENFPKRIPFALHGKGFDAFEGLAVEYNVYPVVDGCGEGQYGFYDRVDIVKGAFSAKEDDFIPTKIKLVIELSDGTADTKKIEREFDFTGKSSADVELKASEFDGL